MLFGIALIFLPGPGSVVIPIGLLILASEFAWARWLLLAWMGFHVVLSLWHTPVELALHALLLALVAWVLFRPAAAAFFRGATIAP